MQKFVEALNKDARKPADLARQHGYRVLAEKIEQNAREVLLMTGGMLRMKETKLHIYGQRQSGQRTLILRGLRASVSGLVETDSNEKVGIFKMRIPDTGDGMWSIGNFAGDMEYFVVQEMWMKAANSLYIVMWRLNEPRYR